MGGGRVRVLGNPDQRSQDDSDEGSEFEKPHAGHERGWTLLRRPTYLPECAGFHKSHGEPTFQLLHILTSTMSSLSFLIVCTSRNILLGGIFAGALSLIRRGKGFSFNSFIPTSTCITQADIMFDCPPMSSMVAFSRKKISKLMLTATTQRN